MPGGYGMQGNRGGSGMQGNRGGYGMQGGYGGMRGGGMQGGGGEDKKEEKLVTGIRVEPEDDQVVVKVTLAMDNLKTASVDNLYGIANLLLLGFRGELDLYNGEKHLHRLADGLKRLGQQRQGMPQGAFRELPPSRNRYEYDPEKRVSWMTELLPFMGYQKLYGKVRKEKSWDDPDNLVIARTIIPEFLDPDYPRSSHYVAYPGLKMEVAATHYVALAGLGEDVASESEDDAGDRAGAFNYNRATPFGKFKRGAGHTAVLMKVAPKFGSPWMAGGGSTVRSVPETGKLDDFLDSGDGKGTYVLMGDGSVRYVSKTINPEVFRAMCTLKRDVDFKEEDWKKVDPKAEMKGGNQGAKPAPQPNQIPPKQ
jgi:hypothetical protein